MFFVSDRDSGEFEMISVRSSLRVMAVAILMLTLSPLSFAQNESGKENRTLTTKDGWPIHITYYESGRGKESPVIILLPGVEGNDKSMTRKVWDGAASALQKDGFAVVTVDLRKHGDSVPLDGEGQPDKKAVRLLPSDYALMATQDLEAVKDFLVGEHQKEKLNIRKLGVAAAGSSCLVASAFTAADWAKKPWPDAPTLAMRTPKGQDVRAVMMLSPKSTVKGLNATTLMRAVGDPAKGIAVHIYFNPSDRAEKSSADKLYRFLKLKEDPDEARKSIEGPPDKQYSAEGLLQGRAREVMEKNIKEFFDKFVKQREDQWKTRTSRL